MPDFSIVSLGGFPTNFGLEAIPPYTTSTSTSESAYLARLQDCIALLADLAPRNGVPEPPQLTARKEAVRDRAVALLRNGAEKLIASAAGTDRDAAAEAEIIRTYRIEGRHRDWMTRLETTPFTIEPVGRTGSPNVLCDLKIKARDVYINPDKGLLKTEIDNVLNVTKAVFAERESTLPWAYFLIGAYKKRVQATHERLHEYILQLGGIADVGLVNMDDTQAPFARLDLVRYKNEFTLKEAGTVKNNYAWRLGFRCFLAVVPLAVAYIIARFVPSGTVMHDFRNFFLLLIGSVCGTWMSFLLRRPELGFDDLAALESDRLDPSMRVIYMMGLAMIVGLLFWARAVIFVLGDFESSLAIYAHGAWTLLLGLLIGVAERTMGTAVLKRSGDIPAAIASATPSAARP